MAPDSTSMSSHRVRRNHPPRVSRDSSVGRLRAIASSQPYSPADASSVGGQILCRLHRLTQAVADPRPIHGQRANLSGSELPSWSLNLETIPIERSTIKWPAIVRLRESSYTIY